MPKIVQVLFITFLIVALCFAEAPRSRTSRIQTRSNRFSERQVTAVETPAVTPYPSADELKPEVAFNEAAPGEEQQSIQPDEVYGPPEEETSVKTDDVNANVGEQTIVNEGTAVAQEEQQAEEEYTSARLTARRTSSARRSSVHPAKLRKATSGRLQRKP